jgi:hypothetical protein
MLEALISIGYSNGKLSEDGIAVNSATVETGEGEGSQHATTAISIVGL